MTSPRENSLGMVRALLSTHLLSSCYLSLSPGQTHLLQFSHHWSSPSHPGSASLPLSLGHPSQWETVDFAGVRRGVACGSHVSAILGRRHFSISRLMSRGKVSLSVEVFISDLEGPQEPAVSTWTSCLESRHLVRLIDSAAPTPKIRLE